MLDVKHPQKGAQLTQPPEKWPIRRVGRKCDASRGASQWQPLQDRASKPDKAPDWLQAYSEENHT